jgi:hypothetical protein
VWPNPGCGAAHAQAIVFRPGTREADGDGRRADQTEAKRPQMRPEFRVAQEPEIGRPCVNAFDLSSRRIDEQGNGPRTASFDTEEQGRGHPFFALDHRAKYFLVELICKANGIQRLVSRTK